MTNINFNLPATIIPRPRWRGFSFALHPDRCKAFFFARMQYSPKQAFTACFAVSMQLYRPRHKTAHRALQRLFLRLHPFNRKRYQTDTSGYNTACTTLKSIHAPGRSPPVPDTVATPDAVQVSAAAYYNKVYKRVQHTADHASGGGSASPSVNLARVSPAGSRCFPRPAACSLAPGQLSGRAVWHPPPGGAVQRQERGGRRGTIGGSRHISFRAFAR